MKTQLVIIICFALFSVGLAFVKISQNQHQTNDQSQKTTVNTNTLSYQRTFLTRKSINIKYK